jgi:hypothetical protein
LNRWDSLLWAPDGNDDFRGGPLSSVRLFGHAHLGQLERCNLQIGGRLPASGDGSCRIENWYARLAVDGAAHDHVHALFEHVIVTATVGDMPQWQRPMSDLLRATPWVPPERDRQSTTAEEDRDARWRAEHGAHPLIIPVRQHFCVNVEFYNDSNHRLLELSHHWRFQCWVHMEGIENISEEDHVSSQDDPVRILRRAAQDDWNAMDIVASWPPLLREQVRERLYQQDRGELAALVAESDAARRRAAPRVGVAVDDLDD